MTDELESDLRQLVEEALHRNGDRISKRIFEGLEGWLQVTLEEGTDIDRRRGSLKRLSSKEDTGGFG